LHFENLFTSAIEVGIATAGFSGIVVVLGQRAQGQWSPSDLGRISLLLQTSFAAIILAFLPLFLDGARVAEAVIWRIGSGCYVVYTALILPSRWRQTRTILEADASVSPRLTKFMFLVVAVFSAVQAYNALLLHAGWPFALAVVFELAMAFLMFVRLIRTLWERPAA
jgi:hypothetical protein